VLWDFGAPRGARARAPACGRCRLEREKRPDAGTAAARETAGRTALARARQGLDEALARLWSALQAEEALELAGSLRRGAPCPVCGSSEHPAPARAGGDVEAARAELDAAEARLSALRPAAAHAGALHLVPAGPPGVGAPASGVPPASFEG